MKDAKNYAIGFLSAVCLFLFYGHTTDEMPKEIDFLKVNYLVVEDMLTSNGMTKLSGTDVTGSIFVHDGVDSNNERKHSHLVEISSDFVGIHRINDDSKMWYDPDNGIVTKVSLGVAVNQHGVVNVYDKYGDMGHQRMGDGKYWNILNK